MEPAVTILLVEDDKSMLDGMSDLLQIAKIGYQINVLTAGNGREALQIITSSQSLPDLIVSDIMMPEMDGYQFLNKVRENPDWVQIPFIFLTAKGEKQDVSKGRMSSADRYITKPFQTTELLELIKALLDRSRQLIQSHKELLEIIKRDLLQILNHELRTPLTYVTAYYEMLAESLTRFKDHEDMQGYLHGIQAGCVRLTKLVEDFIQVMELRTNEAPNHYQANAKPIPHMADLIQEAVQNNQKSAYQHGVQLHYEMKPDLPTIYGDRDSLVNVLNRLLDNAIKFTAHNHKTNPGNVHISTRVSHQELRICIEDDGVGFPQHLQHKIFDLFWQYNRNRMEQQGAGVGLAIVKGIIELHNGRIEVESQEDLGSKFTIILPTLQLTPTAASPASQPIYTPKTASVLIVEDDRHLMEGLQELLQLYEGKYQLNILTAVNGLVGLEVLAQYPADLIISDIMMPHMDGHDFLAKVRQNPNWTQIPFIFLTAKADRQDVHDGYRRGAEEYIIKPYDSDILLGVVTKQLDLYFQRQNSRKYDFDNLKQNILRFITPDFRLPLSIVNQYVQKLSSLEAQTDEEFKESLHEIQNGSMLLNRLVEDFIALVELKTGEAFTAYSLRAQPIQEIGIYLFEIAQTSTAKSIEVQCPLTTNLPLVYGNIKFLSEAIRRLIELGATYSSGTTVWLWAEEVEGQVHISIRFNRPLDEKTLQDLPFLLEKPEPSNAHFSLPNLKLPGFSIANGYIQMHNGRISFHNEPANEPTFVIALPICIP